MTVAENDRLIRTDRMRYVKNTASSRLCYLGILTDVLYFVSIYESNVGSWYYQWLIGVSIVYNLLFMLITFLASEGVKNYQKKYSAVLYVLGAAQFARIFILPLQASRAVIKVSGAETHVMQPQQQIFVIVCLIVSCLALLAAGFINHRKSVILAGHLKTLEERA